MHKAIMNILRRNTPAPETHRRTVADLSTPWADGTPHNLDRLHAVLVKILEPYEIDVMLPTQHDRTCYWIRCRSRRPNGPRRTITGEMIRDMEEDPDYLLPSIVAFFNQGQDTA